MIASQGKFKIPIQTCIMTRQLRCQSGGGYNVQESRYDKKHALHFPPFLNFLSPMQTFEVENLNYYRENFDEQDYPKEMLED